jgi:hypothetical protein
MGYTTDLTKYIVIRGDSTVTNWRARTYNGTTTNDIDTGVVFSGSTWFKLTIYKNIDGSVSFSINNSTPVGISTNLPTGKMQPYFWIKSNSAAAVNFTIDYFDMTIMGLKRW